MELLKLNDKNDLQVSKEMKEHFFDEVIAKACLMKSSYF